MIEKELQSIGLQEKEAKVYLASLELGKATVQQIANKAEIKRPTTYFTIEILMDLGLMSSFYEGKKQYFIAENPEKLLDMLERQRNDVKKREEQFKLLLPQLHSINNRQKDKPVVKYYEGKDAVVSMVKEHSRSARGKEVCVAYSRDMLLSVFDEKALKELAEDRLSQDIKARNIYTWSQGDVSEVPNTESIRVSDHEFPFGCDIAIYEDKVRIASLKDRIVGVVIEDKEIAKAIRSLYDLAWKWVKSQKKPLK